MFAIEPVHVIESVDVQCAYLGYVPAETSDDCRVCHEVLVQVDRNGMLRDIRDEAARLAEHSAMPATGAVREWRLDIMFDDACRSERIDRDGDALWRSYGYEAAIERNSLIESFTRACIARAVADGVTDAAKTIPDDLSLDELEGMPGVLHDALADLREAFAGVGDSPRFDGLAPERMAADAKDIVSRFRRDCTQTARRRRRQYRNAVAVMASMLSLNSLAQAVNAILHWWPVAVGLLAVSTLAAVLVLIADIPRGFPRLLMRGAVRRWRGGTGATARR